MQKSTSFFLVEICKPETSLGFRMTPRSWYNNRFCASWVNTAKDHTKHYQVAQISILPCQIRVAGGKIVSSSFRVAKRNYILVVHAQKRANVTTYANSDQCRTATTVGGIDIPVEAIVMNCPKSIFVFVRAGVKNTAWNSHRSQLLRAHSAACAMRICRWTAKMPRLENLVFFTKIGL